MRQRTTLPGVPKQAVRSGEAPRRDLGRADRASATDTGQARKAHEQQAVESVRGRPGDSLPTDLGGAFGARYGHNFSKVRLHADAAAAESARGLSARAYTVGEDIGFAAGAYSPHTDDGSRLIAHELAHVAQQSRGGAGANAEARADAAADAAVQGETVDRARLGGAPAEVQTKPQEPGQSTPDEAPDVITGAVVAAAPAVPADRTLLAGFRTNKADLTPAHLATIEQIAFQIWLHLSLYADAKASIAITGHTDTTGTEKHNTGLGTARAASAKVALEAALAKQGIDPAKLGPLTTSSKGESALLVPTGDEVAEPQNRRVEVEVTIEVKQPPPVQAPARPLPGMPGGPKIWEVPGFMEGMHEPPGPAAPRSVPQGSPASREWLKDALERDPLLKKLPGFAREKAIGALKDADEKAVEAIIDAVPLDDDYKKAAKAAARALLQTLKGRKFKPPPNPPPQAPDWKDQPAFPKMPGEKIFKLPPIRF